jgi:hypothetical protein
MAQPGVESKGLFRFNRLAQPLHCEFDIERLQGAPTLDFRLISILRVALEIILGPLRGGRVLCELLTDEGIVRASLKITLRFNGTILPAPCDNTLISRNYRTTSHSDKSSGRLVCKPVGLPQARLAGSTPLIAQMRYPRRYPARSIKPWKTSL